MSLPQPALDALHVHGPATRIAVIGASNDPSKYGNIIIRNLLRHGYTVLPIHPTADEISGLPAHARVADIGGAVAIANVVVPPAVALDVVADLDPAQVGVVWFQPGSFNEAVVAAAHARFQHVIAGDCIMVVANWA